ncbi:hypothetical protein IA57_11095 [Mangrovimonas yunxiaonensis]|uniref:Uncharacterized protein n=2 Tax=Mangrovimonas yunxiaonensis TaxID=1197477 RepID=A0A084TJT9_9FLAO|nr:hypothetical protein IA57_11095 [Mangrovimonas yunxiaonensis]GGH43268.1 hypothetical protein GCM10011364_15340 [Mangrovimonas yunxiaonensis]
MYPYQELFNPYLFKMKTITLRTQMLGLLILVVATLFSCSKDDHPLVNNNNNPPNNTNQGLNHTYDIVFSGGSIDGDAFSGDIPDNTVVAVRQQQDGVDRLTLTLDDENQSNELTIAISMIMNGNQPANFGTANTEVESLMTITYNDNILMAQSGTLTITNYGEHQYYGSTVPYFKLEFNAEMLNFSPPFTSQVSGAILVRPLDAG